jgi:hypothetical protein
MIQPNSLVSTRSLARLLLAAGLLASCTDASQTSIEVSQALLATNEIQAPSPGQVCDWVPQTQAGGLYKATGFLEVSPIANPGAEYILVTQIENYLDATDVTDSNGNAIVRGNRNDFHVESFTVNYLSVGGTLAAISPQTVSPLTSAVVRPGGTQGATAVGANMLPRAVINSIVLGMQSHQLTEAGLVLQVQANGRLGSGEPISSGIFRFPVTLLLTPPCGNALSPVALGFGPCCARQDFSVACVPCGGSGQTCCGGLFGSCTGKTPDGGPLTCQQDLLIATGQDDCGYQASPFVHCR